MSDSSLVSAGKTAIVKGSKSFSMASFFFSQEQKEGAWLLYSWCRFVDDEIDRAPSREEAQLKVVEVRKRTQRGLENPLSEEGPYRSLGLLAQKYQIPAKYPLDLIRGLEMDVAGAEIQDEAQLLDYCYCVAGTVGLMMCSVMRVTSEKALPHALAMGQAMQLTNIARDVREDLGIDRIYIPRTWLKEVGLSPENFSLHPEKWESLIARLIERAELSYQDGFAGIKYLPWRAAWAVTTAAFVYRQIGIKISRDIASSIKYRTFTTVGEKIILALKASGLLIFWRLTKS